MNFQNIVLLLAIIQSLSTSGSPLIAQATRNQDKSGNQTQEIVAASNMLHPPFSSWDDKKEAVGIEVDIVNAAAQDLGMQVRWVEKPFSELITSVASGDLDIAVSTIGVTAERQAKVDFSIPYFDTKIVALVSPASRFTTLDSLANARIGADRATTSYLAALKRWPDATLIGEVNEGMKWPEMIESNRIDAFIVDASDQTRLEQQGTIKLFRIEEPLTTERFAIAVNKRAKKLKAAINKQIARQSAGISLRIGGEYQFTSPIGRKLTSLESPAPRLVKDYELARAKYRTNPADADAIIWYGRRAGYLLRLNEAIQIFSIGIEKHPMIPACIVIVGIGTFQRGNSTRRSGIWKKRCR